MSADSEDPSAPADDASAAEAIVMMAASRGLGRRPRLRSAASVGWSAFMGASLTLIVMLLVPEDWLDPPVGFERLSLLFVSLWTLAVVPALSATLLSRSRHEGER